jgi:sorting nexin-1/2
MKDDGEVVVEVSDPKVVDGISKYILYKVKGVDRHGDFDV